MIRPAANAPSTAETPLSAELAAMPLALTLVESHSTPELRKRAAQVLQHHLGLEAVECLYLECPLAGAGGNRRAV